MGAPGRLFDMPVPWLCHRPALQASHQYIDGDMLVGAAIEA